MIRWWSAADGFPETAQKTKPFENGDSDRQTTVEEDIRLVESVQRGLRSRGYVPGPPVIDPKCGVSSEHSIQALQGWMRAAVPEA